MAAVTLQLGSRPSLTARLRWNARLAPIPAATSLKAGIQLPRTSGTCTHRCIPWNNPNLFPRWLYTYFLAVDANFRLKLKSRGISDPDIGSGWSYFVSNKQYIEHISQKTAQMEVSPSRSSIPITVSCIFRLLGVVPISMRSAKPTVSSRRTISPLAWWAVCVRATPSCKRIVSVTCRKGNGVYHQAVVNASKY